MSTPSRSPLPRARTRLALALWCGLGIVLLVAPSVMRARAAAARLGEQVAALTGRAWLPVLVSGDRREPVEATLEVLAARLGRAPEVLQALGARGPERLFFALRWPLYVPASDLTRLVRALPIIPRDPPRDFAFELLKPALLAQMERVNTLYAASSAAAATPDGRAAAMLLVAQPHALEALRRRAQEEADRSPGSVRVEVDSPVAAALLFGASYPLLVAAHSARTAREIVARVSARRAANPRFALRAARSIHDYLPGEAQAQLQLLQQIRAFLMSPTVGALTQAQRDALRPLLPAPLHTLPSAAELPGFVRELFRDADGRFDRIVHLLPAPGLSPDDPEHVARVASALEELGLRSQARGTFVAAAEAARSTAPLPYLTLLWLCSGPFLVRARIRGWLNDVRVRRALVVSLGLGCVWGLGALAVSHWLRSALAQRAPALQLDAVRAFAPFVVQLEQPRFAQRGLRFEAERASLHLSLPWHLALACEGARVQLDSLSGAEIKAELFLGRVVARSSLFAPSVPEELSAEQGEVRARLRRTDAAGAALDLSGLVELQPELFGRLPVLAEADAFLGGWRGSTAPQPVQLRGSLSAPELSRPGS